MIGPYPAVDAVPLFPSTNQSCRWWSAVPHSPIYTWFTDTNTRKSAQVQHGDQVRKSKYCNEYSDIVIFLHKIKRAVHCI